MRYSIVLLFAVLGNLTYAMLYIGDSAAWYHLTHKLQVLLILLAGPLYEHNWVNFSALSGYVLIHLMNWGLYFYGGIHTLSMASGILYAVALLITLIVEKWKS